MNIQEYIESGILETYVMGATSDQERREVDCLSAIYPEIKQELNYLTETLEEYALAHSVEPPADLKAQIMAQLEFGEAPVKPLFGSNGSSGAAPTPAGGTFTVSRPVFTMSWVAAASVAVVMLVFSYFLISQLQQTQRTTAALQTSNGKLQGELADIRSRQQSQNEALALLKLPGTKIISLQGNEKAPGSGMQVYWNEKTQQVAVAIDKMPPLPADQQYQLWGLVIGADGQPQPTDAGVLDLTGNVHKQTRAIAHANAFAVTIEKKGGSPTPTLSNLVAIGNV
jgi:anti-sigma-K factor RskA